MMPRKKGAGIAKKTSKKKSAKPPIKFVMKNPVRLKQDNCYITYQWNGWLDSDKYVFEHEKAELTMKIFQSLMLVVTVFMIVFAFYRGIKYAM